MKSDFLLAITQLAAEKNLPKEVVLNAIESALVSAYRKDSFTPNQELNVKINPDNGKVEVWAAKTVVEVLTDPREELTLEEFATQVNLAVKLPYARSEGGTALPFVQDASGYHRWAAVTIVLFAALAYGPLGLVALAVAQIITWVYGAWCRKNMGGITGDLLGAGNEIIEVTLLLLAAILGSQLDTYIGWGWWLG